MSAFFAAFTWAAHLVPAALVIVLVTLLVRLALLPLSVAAARGQRARTRLAPQVAALRKRHARDPSGCGGPCWSCTRGRRSRRSPGACGLLQLPVFVLLYQLFSAGELGHYALFAAPLGGRWADALAHGGLLGGAGLVYLVLFALVAAKVATFTYRMTRKQMGAVEVGGDLPGMAAMVKVMPLLSFATLVTVAVVPLAAALYVVTSTAWTAAERAVLYRSSK